MTKTVIAAGKAQSAGMVRTGASNEAVKITFEPQSEKWIWDAQSRG